jgi:hypothetical protein
VTDAEREKLREIMREKLGTPECNAALDLLVEESKKEDDRTYMAKADELIEAGWKFELIPGSTTQAEHVMSWYWRRPGPRGGRRFLSTDQALSHLRKATGAKP